MYTLKDWLHDDEERVLYELERLLAGLGVPIGKMNKLREVVDIHCPIAKVPTDPD